MLILPDIVIFSISASPLKCRLAGHVTVNGAGSSKRVVVQKRGTLEYVASIHSKTDGTWELQGLPVYPEKSLVAIAFDDDDPTENAITFDYVSQVE